MIDFKVIDPKDFDNLNETNKKKYIQTVIEEIQKNETLKRMHNIVKRNVKHYKNDFYIHDLYLIQEHEGPFIWMTRETGTDMIPLDEVNDILITWYNCVKKINKNFYYYNEKTLKKINIEEADKIINEYQKN